MATRLADSTTATYDAAICATGYRLSLPFFGPATLMPAGVGEMGVEYGAVDMIVETDGEAQGEPVVAAQAKWAVRHAESEWPGAST